MTLVVIIAVIHTVLEAFSVTDTALSLLRTLSHLKFTGLFHCYCHHYRQEGTGTGGEILVQQHVVKGKQERT